MVERLPYYDGMEASVRWKNPHQPVVVLPSILQQSRNVHRGVIVNYILTINAPLILNVREVIFLPRNCPSLRSVQFGVQKRLGPLQIADYVFCQHTKTKLFESAVHWYFTVRPYALIFFVLSLFIVF